MLTHTGKFRKVTRLFSRKYTGKLYTFRTLGNFESLTTTEDHPILVFGDKGVSWVFANEITLRTYLTRPVITEEEPKERIEYTYETLSPGWKGRDVHNGGCLPSNDPGTNEADWILPLRGCI